MVRVRFVEQLAEFLSFLGGAFRPWKKRREKAERVSLLAMMALVESRSGDKRRFQRDRLATITCRSRRVNNEDASIRDRKMSQRVTPLIDDTTKCQKKRTPMNCIILQRVSQSPGGNCECLRFRQIPGNRFAIYDWH